jgi:hypothetical protein
LSSTFVYSDRQIPEIKTEHPADVRLQENDGLLQGEGAGMAAQGNTRPAAKAAPTPQEDGADRGVAQG